MSSMGALQLSQKTPQFLKEDNTSRIASYVPYLSVSESPDLWSNYEQLLISNLQIGDDKSALLCLNKLISRFGATNERVMALRGLYRETTAEGEVTLDQVLQEYESILLGDPTNIPVAKRRVSLLKTLSRPVEAIAALVEVLETSPTDLEAWAELSDLYFAQAMYTQACFCLEEVLLITPNAWNVHARLGEVLCVSSYAHANKNDAGMETLLAESVRRFCRSIELCDGYFRGFYGLKVATDRLLQTSFGQTKQELNSDVVNSNEGVVPLSLNVVKQLNERATSRIGEIVKQSGTRGANLNSYEESEIIAAKDLLNQGSMRF